MARYFAELQPDPLLVDAYVDMVKTIKIYTAKGMLAEAQMARVAYQNMVRGYEQLSRQGSQKADTFIRDRLRQTAVRPPTSGRLSSAVQSEPLRQPFPGGGVGIAKIATLDKLAVNPNAKKKGEYWRAQEYGTEAHVGRIVPGYFMPGRSAPDVSQFRNHPYFQQARRGRGGKAKKGTPAMVITRPLHARHFLQDGAHAFAVWHAQKSQRINDRAFAALP
jgi:hypothetical protein